MKEDKILAKHRLGGYSRHIASSLCMPITKVNEVLIANSLHDNERGHFLRSTRNMGCVYNRRVW